MKLVKLLLCAVAACSAVVFSGGGMATAAPLMTFESAYHQITERVAEAAKTGATVSDQGPFIFSVAGRGDAYCLDNFASGGGQNNSPVGLWQCNGGFSEHWYLRSIATTSGYNFMLVNRASGRCLDYPASAGDAVGAQFNVYDCKNGAAPGQNFKLVNHTTDGTVAFVFQATSQVVAMDAFASGWVGNGSPVGLWNYKGDPGTKLQHWY